MCVCVYVICTNNETTNLDKCALLYLKLLYIYYNSIIFFLPFISLLLYLADC